MQIESPNPRSRRRRVGKIIAEGEADPLPPIIRITQRTFRVNKFEICSPIVGREVFSAKEIMLKGRPETAAVVQAKASFIDPLFPLESSEGFRHVQTGTYETLNAVAAR